MDLLGLFKTIERLLKLGRGFRMRFDALLQLNLLLPVSARFGSHG